MCGNSMLSHKSREAAPRIDKNVLYKRAGMRAVNDVIWEVALEGEVSLS